ncbi:hypothetical protein [Tepidimonas sp.]|uniref:hypothetical protein n=1 Tax=Tepidimonas sp. TaxID=2002775 RepID=UPI00391CFF6A
MMKRIERAWLALLLAAGLVHAEPPGGLADFVLRATRPASDLKPLAAQSACVRDYLTTLPATSPLWRDPSAAGPERALPARRAQLVAQIEWLLGARVHAQAHAFAAAFPLHIEGEGQAEVPLTEARYVQAWLNERSDSALAPFLHLLQTHRLLAALAAPDLDPALRPDLQRQAHAARQRALEACPQLGVRQGLCRCIVDELRDPSADAARYVVRWRATLQSGERWQQRLPDGLDVVLEPRAWGWEIMVADPRRPEAGNLARLTPPLHFQPNPREIEGWHFMKNPRRCKSRPYQAEAGPDNPRVFIFSPAVADMREPPSTERIASDGRGRLQIESVRLARPDGDGCPPIEQLRFSLAVEGGLAPGQSAP